MSAIIWLAEVIGGGVAGGLIALGIASLFRR